MNQYCFKKPRTVRELYAKKAHIRADALKCWKRIICRLKEERCFGEGFVVGEFWRLGLGG